MFRLWPAMLQRRRFAGRVRLLFYRLRRYPLFKVLITIFAVAILAAIGVTFAEKYSGTSLSSLSNGLWWALVTMTTVGYGDMTPVTGLGRIIAVVVMLSGVALV
jgi:voltage-gated potassium channel